MNKIALIKAEIERLIAEYDKLIEEQRVRREELACLKEDFIDTLSEEPDKSLEEAARRYAIPTYMKDVDENFLDEYPYDPVAEKAFIAGAKWQTNHAPLPEDTVLFQKGVEEGRRLEREDIMKDAVEKTVGQLERQWGGNIHFMHGFEVDEMDFPFLNSQECGYGDKVRIIVKEDSHE